MSIPGKYEESGFDDEGKKLEYLLGKAKLYKLSSAEEQELRNLIEKEAPALKDAPINELVDTGLIRIGIKTMHKNMVNEINNIIDSWGPLPSRPYELIDSDPFVTVNPSVKAYLKKEGDKIKIHSTNVGDMEISEEELGDRIGTGLDFLELLSHRLDTFKDYMFFKARDDDDMSKAAPEPENKSTFFSKVNLDAGYMTKISDDPKCVQGYGSSSEEAQEEASKKYKKKDE